MNQLRQLLSFRFMLNCGLCKAAVLDPDKKKGQTTLRGKCPSCGGESKGEIKKTKKERKAERKAARNAGARGKH